MSAIDPNLVLGKSEEGWDIARALHVPLDWQWRSHLKGRWYTHKTAASQGTSLVEARSREKHKRVGAALAEGEQQ